MHPPGRSFLALGFALALSSSSAFASVLWFGDRSGLHAIDTTTNTIVVNVPIERPVAVAVNAAGGSVWVMTQSRIAHFSSSGALLFEHAQRDLGSGLGAPRLLSLNPNDGSVWAAYENRIVHFDAAGAVLGSLNVSALALAIGQDGSLWVLESSSLHRYDANGNRALSAPIAATRRMKFIALDDTGAALWLGGEREVVKLSAASPDQTLLSFFAPETISALSIDTQTGDLWILGQQSLFSSRRDGSPSVSRDLRDFSIANPQAMLYDFGSQSAWVGHQSGLSRISSSGTFVATFPADVSAGTIAIGSAPVDITPVVSILAPADGALLNTARPRITAGYDALCGAQACGFPNSFFSTFTLSALLNGTEVGALFVFDAATGTASFTPAAPLPQGANTLSAKATDSFGHESETVSVTFFVDTIAPIFGAVAPPSGTTFTAPSITITGSVDDAQASVSLGSQTQGQFFNFAVTLVRGANNFTLVARDPAGNSAPLALTYIFDPPNVPPTVSITAPPNGQNYEAPATINITANAADSDGHIVAVEFSSNGVVFSTDTTFPYAATLANAGIGSYTLTARAVDDRTGATTSDPVSVTVGPPNALPTIQLLSPSNNTPFSAPATVPVLARASDSDGTIAKVEFFRNGVLVATVLTGSPDFAASIANVPAGSHSITARATDDRGATRTTAAAVINVQTTSIVINSPAPNALIDGDSVVVAGRITAMSNSGVIVNGVRASVDSFGNFFAVVHLVAGANTLRADLLTVDLANVSASVNVNATGAESPFVVETTDTRGLSTLNVTFTVRNPTSAAASFTFDGFGPFPLPAGSSSQLSVGYPAGAFAVNLVFTSPQGTFTHSVTIESRSEAQMDAMFRSIWSGLTSALAAGDRELALRYLDGGARARYAPVFDTLMPEMAQIIPTFSPPAKGFITNNAGEYGVSRLDAGVRYLYFVTFVQGADGVWRVNEM